MPPSTRILFAGDALAVVGYQVRRMARHVTADLEASAHSMQRCLERPIDHLCPGHLRPLSRGARERCEALLARLRAGERWPLRCAIKLRLDPAELTRIPNTRVVPHAN